MNASRFELFSDYFAQSENILTKIDARVKLLFCFIFTLLILSSTKTHFLFCITLFFLVILLILKLPFNMVFIRMLPAVFMSVAVIFLKGLFLVLSTGISMNHSENNVQAISQLNVLNSLLYIFLSGAEDGFLIAGRILAATSLVLLLSMTTSLGAMISALAWFKVPSQLLEIMVYTYRYIFIFVEEAQNILDSQRLRLGYQGVKKSLSSWGILIGSLFARVYDQANATYDAMIIRGYNGNLYIKPAEKFERLDVFASALMGVLLIAIFASGVWR